MASDDLGELEGLPQLRQAASEAAGAADAELAQRCGCSSAARHQHWRCERETRRSGGCGCSASLRSRQQGQHPCSPPRAERTRCGGSGPAAILLAGRTGAAAPSAAPTSSSRLATGMAVLIWSSRSSAGDPLSTCCEASRRRVDSAAASAGGGLAACQEAAGESSRRGLQARARAGRFGGRGGHRCVAACVAGPWRWPCVSAQQYSI